MVPSRCAGAVYGSGSLRNETKRNEDVFVRNQIKHRHQSNQSTFETTMDVESKPPLKSLCPKRRYITQKTPETLDEKICPRARISESVSNGDDPSSVRPASRRPFDRRLVPSTRAFGVNNFTSFAFAFAIDARTTSYGQPRQPRPIASSPWWTPPIGSS